MKQKTLFSPIVPFKKLKSTKAWLLTSELVRKKAKGRCYTCGGKYPMNKLVAGHFLEKIGNAATYFDLNGLRAQCQWYCNRMRHGAKDIYALKLIEEVGLEAVQALKKKAHKSKQWTKAELETIRFEREEFIKNLTEHS